MTRTHKPLFLAGVMLGLALLWGCKTTETTPKEPERNSESVELGKELFIFAGQGKLELGVIRLRKGLQRLNETDCEFGFIEAGGSQDNWKIYVETARNSEFETGMRYGEKLSDNKILDVDVVEYLKSTLKNADRARKLAFSAGFVSVFPDYQRGLDHLHTMWIWAMPSD